MREKGDKGEERRKMKRVNEKKWSLRERKWKWREFWVRDEREGRLRRGKERKWKGRKFVRDREEKKD